MENSVNRVWSLSWNKPSPCWWNLGTDTAKKLGGSGRGFLNSLIITFIKLHFLSLKYKWNVSFRDTFYHILK